MRRDRLFGPTTRGVFAIIGIMGIGTGRPWAWGGQEEFNWRGQVDAGDAIEIKGVNGSVHASGGSGEQVEVRAMKTASKSDPESVRIEVVEHAAGVTICAVYPGRGKPNECRPGEGGHMQVNDNDVSVEFTVLVPKGVRFVGRTVNGSVDASAIAAPVDVTTVNGSIAISTAADAEAATVNGSIEASLGSGAWTGPREFETVNGRITVTLPASVSADVVAETVNGDISTDFPLTVTGRFGLRWLKGSIGGGGRQLRLETVNGDIELLRAS
jgi:hypothetical protein